ncbi:MAG: discoidin domain-containing protein [Actinobacteria bacterium]|nr:discoidin domain-containing protein [Actinomycetota bacterium]
MPEVRLLEKPGHLFGKVMRIFSYKPEHALRKKSKHTLRKINAKVLALAIAMALITQLTMPIISFNPTNHLALAAGNTYYVSPSGNDLNPGTLSSPFRTIQKGVNVAQAGDTVLVRAGTYVESITFQNSGTSTARLVVKNYPNEKPVLNGNGMLSRAIDFNSKSHIRFEGFEITNYVGSSSALWLGGSSATDIEIVGNYIHRTQRGSSGTGISGAWSGGSGTGHKILNNRITDTPGRGILLTNTSNTLIKGNEIFGLNRDGIYFAGKMSNLIVENNHIYNNTPIDGDHVDNIQMSSGTWQGNLNIIIRNNLFGRAGHHQVILAGAGGFRLYNNIFYGGTTYQYGVALRLQGTDYTHVFNNTVVDTEGKGGLVVSRWPEGDKRLAQSVRIFNNIVLGTSTSAAVINGDGGNPDFQEGNNIKGGDLNAIFVNPSVRDYRLKAGSPAIDKGYQNTDNKLSYPATDMDGKARIVNKIIDIGAYEYGASNTAPAPTQPNLALNKPAYSSAFSRETREPTKAVDGDKTTYWAVSASQGLPQWFYVDLGKTYDLNKVRMISDSHAYPSAYKVSVSSDAVNWKQVYSTTTGKGSTEEIAIPENTTGRYIRLDVTAKSDTPYGFGVYEFEVYGQEAPQDITPPKVAITEPANNATVSGNVYIKASATDDKGIQKVEFYIDGALKKTVSASPYEYTWDSTTIPDGAHKILAKAYDTSGNTAPAEITINVKNAADIPTPPQDTTPPVTTITDPTGTETLSGSEKLIKGTTTDDVEVSKVEVAVQREDGVYWTGSGWSTSETWLPTTVISGAGTKTLTWSYSWKIAPSDSVVYKIKARGTDTSGNIEDTAFVVVKVDNIAPSGTITINSGAESTTETNVTVTNSITGAAKMRFSVDGGSTWTAWEDYATSKTLTLTGGLGVKTVKGQFSDGVNVYETSDSIELKGSNVVSISVTYPAGWNLVAVPTGNDISTNLFGSYDPKTGGYKKVDSPTTGEGYWAHFGQPTTVSLTFNVIDKFDINLESGWNMVSNPFDRDVALPQGYTAYIYNPETRSYETTNIIPKGNGAWIYVSNQQVLILHR